MRFSKSEILTTKDIIINAVLNPPKNFTVNLKNIQVKRLKITLISFGQNNEAVAFSADRRMVHKPYVYEQNTLLGVQKYAVKSVLSVLHLKSSSLYSFFNATVQFSILYNIVADSARFILLLGSIVLSS